MVGPYANGGIGTHCYYLASYLSLELDQEVSLLYTGKIEQQNETYWQEWFQEHLRVNFVWLQPPEGLDQAPAPLRSVYVNVARNVYGWLRKQSFDACYFQEMLGNGFRCIQAKRLGLEFQQTLLTCTVHSSWEWISQAMRTLPQAGLEELQTKFMERYCIEHCDVLISPSRYMLDWLEKNRVRMPQRKQVLPYLFDPELRPVGFRPANHKVIFFGRLEVRKGLLLFLEALLLLDRQGVLSRQALEVTFLGKSGYTPDGGGVQSIEKFRAGLSSSVRLKVINDLGHRDAIRFLTENNDALVVCPSLIDNSPYAVIESLQLGLNVIAARTGGIPELFAESDRLFEPEPAALAGKIEAGLANRLPEPSKRYDLEGARRFWQKFCQETPRSSSVPVRGSAAACELPVRVFLASSSDVARLQNALKSLEAQTFKSFSVTLITSERTNAGLPREIQAYCRARSWNIQKSFSLEEQGYALFITNGSVPKPELLERLILSLGRANLEAVTCCGEMVKEGADLCFSYEPLGACVEGGLFGNVFGTGALLLRTGGEVGLWPAPERLLSPAGMWAFLAEISQNGRKWDVLPDKLVTLKGGVLQDADLDYGEAVELIESYCRTSPIWLRYLMLHTIALERSRVQQAQRASISLKLKRETRRILKPCQSLIGTANPDRF